MQSPINNLQSTILPRHSRAGGNRHNPTESDEPQRKLVPARDARTRARQRLSRPHAHTLLRHSRTQLTSFPLCPRHSREGGNPPRQTKPHPHNPQSSIINPQSPPRIAFDKTELTYYPRPMVTPTKPHPKETILQSAIPNPPTSFPRRRESTPLRPHSQSDGPPSTVNGNRQNPTESDKIRRKLVCVRSLIHAHAREARLWRSEIPACAGMTWVSTGMTESPTCCGPGTIHAAKVNGKNGTRAVSPRQSNPNLLHPPKMCRAPHSAIVQWGGTTCSYGSHGGTNE